MIFPVHADLLYKPLAEKARKEPEADGEDKKLAREKTDRAKPIKETVKSMYSKKAN